MENSRESPWNSMDSEALNGGIAIKTENREKDKTLWREDWENILGGGSKAKPLREERTWHFPGTERKLE